LWQICYFAQKKKKKRKKKEKRLGKLSFSVLDVFFPTKKGCHKLSNSQFKNKNKNKIATKHPIFSKSKLNKGGCVTHTVALPFTLKKKYSNEAKEERIMETQIYISP
jgi:hypothetical protein